MFRDELEQGRTTFSALPARAKLTLLRHGFPAETTIPTALDSVNVSFVKLNAGSVEAAMLRYFPGPSCRRASNAKHESVWPQKIDATRREGSPCLLRPGYGIFVDSWSQVATYCERGDTTVPLLAVDWLDFHNRRRASLTTCSADNRSHY